MHSNCDLMQGPCPETKTKVLFYEVVYCSQFSSDAKIIELRGTIVSKRMTKG
jgi:hypothetical protein